MSDEELTADDFDVDPPDPNRPPPPVPWAEEIAENAFGCGCWVVAVALFIVGILFAAAVIQWLWAAL